MSGKVPVIFQGFPGDVGTLYLNHNIEKKVRKLKNTWHNTKYDQKRAPGKMKRYNWFSYIQDLLSDRTKFIFELQCGLRTSNL